MRKNSCVLSACILLTVLVICSCAAPAATPSPVPSSPPPASQPAPIQPPSTPPTPLPTPQVKEEPKKIIIDGDINEWSSRATMITDPCGDVADNAKDKRAVDLKAIYALMDEDYLYMAIQLCDTLISSPFRNYFVALDFNDDQQDEYHFGFRYDGTTWVWDHTDKNYGGNPKMNPQGILVYGEIGKSTIETRISRKQYQIPSTVLIYSRDTEGAADVDRTRWFEVKQIASATK